MKAKKELKKTYVCIRLSIIDKKQLKQASKKVKTKWLTFIRSSALKEADKILKG